MVLAEASMSVEQYFTRSVFSFSSAMMKEVEAVGAVGVSDGRKTDI